MKTAVSTYVPIPIILNTTKEVECIVQEGKKYCEQEEMDFQVFGITSLIIICWIAGWAFCLIKAVDSYGDEGGWFALAAVIFVLPLILMALFG